MNADYATVPQPVQGQPKPRRRFTVQRDEWGAVVDDKGNEQWGWIALDVETRAIGGGLIGDRCGECAPALWRS